MSILSIVHIRCDFCKTDLLIGVDVDDTIARIEAAVTSKWVHGTYDNMEVDCCNECRPKYRIKEA